MPPLKDKASTKKGADQAQREGQGAEPRTEEHLPATHNMDLVEIVSKRAVLHQKLFIRGTDEHGNKVNIDPVSYASRQQMEELLGWETEAQYTARRLLENKERKERGEKELTAEECAYGDDYLLVDEDGNKVRCGNNLANREFKEWWARSLAQEVLSRRWAGATGEEGDTVNGETIIVGRTGLTLSLQHRGIGFILACQIWKKDHHFWSQLWPEEPKLPCIIVYGVNETPKVVNTIDNVLSRTDSDVIYVSGIFNQMPDWRGNLRPSTSVEKKECSRMLSRAVDFLWHRTDASGQRNDSKRARYQTTGAVMDFIARHPRIEKCVYHIFQENRERAFSAMKIDPGICAGLMYLMGSCLSDGDQYRHKDSPAERNEKGLDWLAWDKAKEFWVNLAKKEGDEAGGFAAIYDARKPQLGEGFNEYGGWIFANKDGGSTLEKVGTLIKAWKLFFDNVLLTVEGITLSYHQDMGDDDLVLDYELTEFPVLDGIDLGEPEKKAKKPKDGEGKPTEQAAANREPADSTAATPAASISAATSKDSSNSKDNKPAFPGKGTRDDPAEIERRKAEARAQKPPANETPEQERKRRELAEKTAQAAREAEQTKPPDAGSGPKAKPVKRKK